MSVTHNFFFRLITSSPYSSAKYLVDLHPALLAIHVWLLIVLLSSFLITAFMDPGIYPRRSKPDELNTASKRFGSNEISE